MRQCMDSENLHRRLKKIIGQVQAIDRMVDEDVPCEDILAQINAAKSALHRVGQVVLESQKPLSRRRAARARITSKGPTSNMLLSVIQAPACHKISQKRTIRQARSLWFERCFIIVRKA